MEISEREQKSIANFKYWIDTNTERGVCYLPDYICAKVLNLIEKLQKENEELKNQEATARRINELLVQRYSNSIPVQKVKEKIKELKEEIEQLRIERNVTYDSGIYRNQIKIDILQELLEVRNKNE